MNSKLDKTQSYSVLFVNAEGEVKKKIENQSIGKWKSFIFTFLKTGGAGVGEGISV